MTTLAEVYGRRPRQMCADDLKVWAKRMGLSPDQAAMALGLAPSSYRNQAYGHRPVSSQTARIAELIEAAHL